MSNQRQEQFVFPILIFETHCSNGIHLTARLRMLLHFAQFKKKLLLIIRPVKNSTYRVSDISGIRLLTRLRLQFSALNEHRVRHAFDCLSPVCNYGLANEDNEHFLLHCPQYYILRLDLFGQLSDISGIDLTRLDHRSQCNLFLYGSPRCSEIENSIILESTISYIKDTGRFD